MSLHGTSSVVLVSELDKLGSELPFNVRRRATVYDVLLMRGIERDRGAWCPSSAGRCVAWQDEDGELVCIVEVYRDHALN